VHWTILLYGAVAATAELLGGGLVILKKKWPRKIQEYLLALSAGFLLALVFLELVPESLRAVGDIAPVTMLLGYAVLHFFEHTIVGHLHFGEETHRDVMVSRAASLSTFVGLSVHAFFDGFAISVAMQFDFAVGLLVFVAVLLHKIPEGLTIASVMLVAERRRATSFLASAAVAVSTMLGILAAFALGTVSDRVMGLAFAFSAGLTTYVGASDLIPEINSAKNRIVPLLVFGGMLLLYGAKLLLVPLGGH
jgi:zinc transporter ZupT